MNKTQKVIEKGLDVGTSYNISNTITDYLKNNSYFFEPFCDISEYQDLSEERDINELLLVTDILVTDYSSVIFDWAFLNKPIIYFAYDKEDYENGRGLYFPFKEYIFGEVAKDTKELIKAIKKADLCEDKREKFIEKFISACDGKSTEKTYKWIFESEKDEDNN